MPEALLPLILLLPLAGAVLVPLANARVARVLALAVMLVVLALATTVFVGFDGAGGGAPPINLRFMATLGVGLHFGVDGFNVYLLLLTALLFPVVLACVWHSAEAQRRLYLVLMLALQTCLLGTFLAQNLVVFFVFWEAVLIPMLLLILVFGGPQRRRAAITFFLYTMAGSVLLLAAVILLGVEHLNEFGYWSFDYEALYGLHLSHAKQAFVFGAIVLACAIKSPLFPFHAWLPLTYGQASTSGTALMAGLLSKMGAFGFIKLALPLCPDVAPVAAPAMVLLAVASILYGAVLALRQQDLKMLIAYSSLSHMGFIVLGVFSFQHTALHGAMFQMLSHGVAVAGLFLLLGLLEQRAGAGYLQMSALASRAPRLAVLTMLFVLTSLALPLTSGFTAEFLILLGAFTEGLAAWQADAGALRLTAALLAATAVVLGAGYMLRFARMLVFGTPGGARLPDLNPREAVAFAPLLLLVLWIGIWPAPLMTKVQNAVSHLASFSVGPAPAQTTPQIAVGKDAHGK
jgi:NADH-quinone oxidoreductase subunit M